MSASEGGISEKSAIMSWPSGISTTISSSMIIFSFNANCAKNPGQFYLALGCDSVDQILQCTLHEVDCTIITILGLLAGNSRLNVDAGDCKVLF